MPDPSTPFVFDQQRATSYEQRYAKIAPLREALQLVIRVLLAELPENANILCVGVGTGSELIKLAEVYPNWHFTAVEPAEAMMKICHQRVQEAGIGSRCTFHEGYLHTLPSSAPFDAATCLLVSHFLTDLDERVALFREIASRLRPGGLLVNADLSYDISGSTQKELVDLWFQMQRYGGLSEEEVVKMRSDHKTSLSILPPAQIEALLQKGGFSSPTLFLQTVLIHAWFTRRS